MSQVTNSTLKLIIFQLGNYWKWTNWVVSIIILCRSSIISALWSISLFSWCQFSCPLITVCKFLFPRIIHQSFSEYYRISIAFFGPRLTISKWSSVTLTPSLHVTTTHEQYHTWNNLSQNETWHRFSAMKEFIPHLFLKIIKEN